MHMRTSPTVILIESLLFGAMIGAIMAVALIVLGDWSVINAIALGAVVGPVIGLILSRMSAGFEPPRGPGNPPGPDVTTGSGGATTTAAGAVPSGAGSSDGTAASAATDHNSTGGAAEAAPTTAGTKPLLLTEARNGHPDDLRQIKGVGPKLETALHQLGVFHYDQIANWSADEVAWMDDNLVQFKGRVSRDDWVTQAKALASG